jgi:hypothetical protein
VIGQRLDTELHATALEGMRIAPQPFMLTRIQGRGHGLQSGAGILHKQVEILVQ